MVGTEFSSSISEYTATIMAVVAAMISTITTATTPPMMATVLSEGELHIVLQQTFVGLSTYLELGQLYRLADRLRESIPCISIVALHVYTPAWDVYVCC